MEGGLSWRCIDEWTVRTPGMRGYLLRMSFRAHNQCQYLHYPSPSIAGNFPRRSGRRTSVWTAAATVTQTSEPPGCDPGTTVTPDTPRRPRCRGRVGADAEGAPPPAEEVRRVAADASRTRPARRRRRTCLRGASRVAAQTSRPTLSHLADESSVSESPRRRVVRL